MSKPTVDPRKKIVISFAVALVSVSVFFSILFQIHFAQPLTQFTWAQEKRSEQLLSDKKLIQKGEHPLCRDFKYSTSCFKKVLKHRLPLLFSGELMIWTNIGAESVQADEKNGFFDSQRSNFYYIENTLLAWNLIDFKQFYVQKNKNKKIMAMSKSIFLQAKQKMKDIVKMKFEKIKNKISTRQPASELWQRGQYQAISAQYRKFEALQYP